MIGKAFRDSGTGLDRIFDIVDTVAFYATAALTVGIVVLVVVAVVMRYWIGSPLVYSYDLSTLVFAWIVFLGISLSERDGRHLAVDIIDHALSKHWSKRLMLFRKFVLICLSLTLAWIGWSLVMRAGMTLPSLGIAVRWLYVSLPIGFLLLAIAQLGNLIRGWREC